MIGMTRRACASLLTTASLLGLAAVGCDDGMPPVATSSEEVTVTGTVKLKGQPLEDGEVTFDGNNIKRKSAGLRTAKIKGGAYEIKALIGGNSVTVQSKAIAKDLGLSANQKYVELNAGENKVDIDL